MPMYSDSGGGSSEKLWKRYIFSSSSRPLPASERACGGCHDGGSNQLVISVRACGGRHDGG
jgi:hypothetical protein